MKKCSIIGLLFFVCLTNIVYAYSSSHNTNLVNQIKPNPITRSKPTSTAFSGGGLDLNLLKSSSIKLASVQFLTDRNSISFDKGEVDIKTKCASLGFVIPVSDCVSPMKPSYLCSSEINDSGASQYTTGCCNSNLYTAPNANECTDNSTALNDSCYYDGANGKKK